MLITNLNNNRNAVIIEEDSVDLFRNYGERDFYRATDEGSLLVSLNSSPFLISILEISWTDSRCEEMLFVLW